jgi:hypothetical protein
MNPDYCVKQLTTNIVAIQGLVAGINADQARWKPTSGDWSIVEVINHLLDEERNDFRARIRHLLSGSDEPWPPIAPDEWTADRAYNQRDLHESGADFARERQDSLTWLSGLAKMDWDIAYVHPPLDGLTAGDLLVSWAAHDLLHLRQLVELKWLHTQTMGAPFSTRYAGDW